MLAHVRMPLLKRTFLADQVTSNPLVRQSLSCRDLIDEAKDYHLIPERRDSLRTFKVQQRGGSLVVPGLVYVCGGLNTDYQSASKVEMFDPLAGCWFPVRSMLSARIRVGVTALDGEVYVLGGYTGRDRLDTVEIFDPRRGVWREVGAGEAGVLLPKGQGLLRESWSPF